MQTITRSVALLIITTCTCGVVAWCYGRVELKYWITIGSSHPKKSEWSKVSYKCIISWNLYSWLLSFRLYQGNRHVLDHIIVYITLTNETSKGVILAKVRICSCVAGRILRIKWRIEYICDSKDDTSLYLCTTSVYTCTPPFHCITLTVSSCVNDFIDQVDLSININDPNLPLVIGFIMSCGFSLRKFKTRARAYLTTCSASTRLLQHENYSVSTAWAADPCVLQKR